LTGSAIAELPNPPAVLDVPVPGPSSPIQPASSPLVQPHTSLPTKEPDIEQDSFLDSPDDPGEESQPPHLRTFAGREADDSKSMLPPPEMAEEEGQLSYEDDVDVMWVKEESSREDPVEGYSTAAAPSKSEEDASCPVCGERLEGRTAKVCRSAAHMLSLSR